MVLTNLLHNGAWFCAGALFMLLFLTFYSWITVENDEN